LLKTRTLCFLFITESFIKVWWNAFRCSETWEILWRNEWR
jgi:hypothetical protein